MGFFVGRRNSDNEDLVKVFAVELLPYKRSYILETGKLRPNCIFEDRRESKRNGFRQFIVIPIRAFLCCDFYLLC